MKKLVYGMILLLTLAHQDCWWWDDSETLVFGFIPIGLAYHAGVSLVAALLWAMAVKYCWPEAVNFPDQPASNANPSVGAPA